MTLRRIAYSLSILLVCGTVARGETLTSSSYPITVHHKTSLAENAKAVLAAVESAWKYNLETLKLPPPPADNGAHGSDDYDVFIEPTPHGGVTSSETPAADRRWGWCTKIVLDPSIPLSAVPLVISHEFHHAVQAGICRVGNNLAEAGAVYASGLHQKGQGWRLSYFLGFNAFQDHPERSLDWQGVLGDFYPYGGALYFMFLDQVYGDGQGSMLTKIWNGIAEPKNPGKDCPHYFDAIRELVDFDDAFKVFCRWRYFVGPEDDGHHFKDLVSWDMPGDPKLRSVPLAHDLLASSLPLTKAGPKVGVMPYGASYLRLSLKGLAKDDRIRLDFSGDKGTRWSVQTILIGGGGPPVEGAVDADESGAAALELLVGAHEKLVLAFANLGDVTYTPDGPGWKESQLTYSLTRLGPPQIDSVTPALLPAGSETWIMVKGQRFGLGTPEVAFSSPDVTAGTVREVADGVEVLAAVAQDTSGGPADLTLSWGEITATKASALELEADEAAGEGGCALSPVASGGLSLLLLLPIALMMVSRRRGGRLLACALVAWLVLGCSGSDDGSPDSRIAADSVASSDAAPSPDIVQSFPDQGSSPDALSGPGAFGKACTADKDCDPAAPVCLIDENKKGFCSKTCVDPENQKACYPTPPGGLLPLCALEDEKTGKLYCIFLCELAKKQTWPCPPELTCGPLSQDVTGMYYRTCQAE